MSLENLLNNLQVVPSTTPPVQIAAVVSNFGQRTVSIGKDIRIVSSVQIGGAEVLVLASGQNGNTKFWLPVINDSGKREYVYLGPDKDQARSNAQELFKTNKISKSEVVLGNQFALRSYSKSSLADSAGVEEMNAQVAAMLAEAWRNQGDLMAKWIEAVSGNTPEDRHNDERKKIEQKQSNEKQSIERSESNRIQTAAFSNSTGVGNVQDPPVAALILTPGDKVANYRVITESIVARVIAVADGRMTKSEALAGLPDFLAKRVELLIDAAVASQVGTANNSSVGRVGAENQKFAIRVQAQAQFNNPLNIQQETSAA